MKSRLSTTPWLLVLVCLMKGSVIGQSDPLGRSDAVDGSWLRTTPFASLPGMTTQQVLRSILPPNVIPYTPVSSPEETAGYVRDYVSTFKMQSRGMEHLHTYTNMFMGFIMPRHLVPPGNYQLLPVPVIFSPPFCQLGFPKFGLRLDTICRGFNMVLRLNKEKVDNTISHT